MAEYSKDEFDIMKKQAAQRVMDMYKGVESKMPPYPDFISVPKREEKVEKVKKETYKVAEKCNKNPQYLRYLNFSELAKNKDGLLLIGLILLLSSEGTDELLVLALAYVLL